MSYNSLALTSIAGIAAITKMQAATPSRNKPAPRRRPGRLDEAAADIALGATAEQVGLVLQSAFWPALSFTGCLMHKVVTGLCRQHEGAAEALHSTYYLGMRQIA